MNTELVDQTLNAVTETDLPNWFENWIIDNWHIWEAFKNRADQIAATGVSHYSAYTIVEVMRWETDLRETNSKFKISNNVKPCLARLYEAVNPQRKGFFRIKKGGS